MRLERLIVALLVGCALVFGCKRRDHTPPEPVWLKAPVEIVFNLDDGDQPLRAPWMETNQPRTVQYDGFSVTFNDPNQPQVPLVKADAPANDKAVKDLNMFFVYNHQKTVDGNIVTGPLHNNIARHVYFRVAPSGVPQTVSIKDVYAGKYKLYVVANYGGSMCAGHITNKDFNMQEHLSCPMTLDGIKNFVTKQIHPLDYNSRIGEKGVPMVSVDENFNVDLRPDERDPFTFDLNMTRLVSKFDIGFNLTEVNDPLLRMADFALTNIPQLTQPFMAKVTESALGTDPSKDLRMYESAVNNELGTVQNGAGVIYALPNPQTQPNYTTSLIYHIQKAVGIGASVYSDYWIPIEFDNYNSLFNQNYKITINFGPNYMNEGNLREMSATPVKFKLKSSGNDVDVNGVYNSELIYTDIVLTRKNMTNHNVKLVFSCSAVSSTGMEIKICQLDGVDVETVLIEGRDINSVEYEGSLIGTVESTGKENVKLRCYYKRGSGASGNYLLNVSIQNGSMSGYYLSLNRSQDIKFTN